MPKPEKLVLVYSDDGRLIHRGDTIGKFRYYIPLGATVLGRKYTIQENGIYDCYRFRIERHTRGFALQRSQSLRVLVNEPAA